MGMYQSMRIDSSASTAPELSLILQLDTPEEVRHLDMKLERPAAESSTSKGLADASAGTRHARMGLLKEYIA
eukprot:gene16016-22153_t